MVTQEDINHTKCIYHIAPTIPIATHNMATKIEYQSLPWYLYILVINPDTWDILQYKYIIQSKEK